MKVAIINDLRTATEVLRQVVLSDPNHQVIWTAATGAEGVLLCASQPPDVVLMDLVMPGISGAEATRQIMHQCPCPVLVVTATVTGNYDLVCQAMGHGAYDAVCLPSLGTKSPAVAGVDVLQRIAKSDRIKRHLRAGGLASNRPVTATPPPPTSARLNLQDLLDSAAKAALTAGAPPPAAFAPLESGILRLNSASILPAPSATSGVSLVPIVAIGASTGGPQALDAILTKWPASFPGAVLIVQHIGLDFAESLASWLRERCQVPIHTIKPGERPMPGTVHIAATTDHLIVRRDRTLGYTPNPTDFPYRPSVNALFCSLRAHWPNPGIAVLLTGIGSDGAQGLLELKDAGWHTIAQDKASSVVYGMPQAAAEIGAAMRILPLEEIGVYVAERMRRMLLKTSL